MRHNQRPCQQHYRATVLRCLVAFSNGCDGSQVSVVVSVTPDAARAINVLHTHAIKKEPAVALPANASPPAGHPMRWLAALSALCGGLAVTGSALWTPLMLAMARMFRPPQLDAIPPYRGNIQPFQQAAEERMWVALIVSFLAIIVLAALAILLGRRARRFVGNGVAPLLDKWAVRCLIVSLVAFGSTLLLSLGSALSAGPLVSFRAHVPPLMAQVLGVILEWSPQITLLLISVIAAGALGTFILSGIVVRVPRGRMPTARRWHTRIRLVVSALLLLGWFVITAGAAQFVVAFYLHLVY